MAEDQKIEKKIVANSTATISYLSLRFPVDGSEIIGEEWQKETLGYLKNCLEILYSYNKEHPSEDIVCEVLTLQGMVKNIEDGEIILDK